MAEGVDGEVAVAGSLRGACFPNPGIVIGAMRGAWPSASAVVRLMEGL